MNNRLGKGIGALIKSQESNQNQYLDGMVDINKININPDQPRKYFDKEPLDELIASIKEKGILQPITIRSLEDNSFELIAGERRLRAAIHLKLKTIPAYIIKVDSDVEKLELALIENIQRNDLNPLEEANAYSVLKEKYGLTHEQISKRVGKSRTEITRTLELIKLPDNIKESLIKNSNNPEFKFTRGHARTILSLKDPLKIQSLFQKILKEGLSVRNTEKLVKGINKIKIDKVKESFLKDFLSQEDSLSSFLKTKVEISASKKAKGFIKIDFKSKEELYRIIDVIKSFKKWNKSLCNKFRLVTKFIDSISHEK